MAYVYVFKFSLRKKKLTGSICQFFNWSIYPFITMIVIDIFEFISVVLFLLLMLLFSPLFLLFPLFGLWFFFLNSISFNYKFGEYIPQLILLVVTLNFLSWAISFFKSEINKKNLYHPLKQCKDLQIPNMSDLCDIIVEYFLAFSVSHNIVLLLWSPAYIRCWWLFVKLTINI